MKKQPNKAPGPAPRPGQDFRKIGGIGVVPGVAYLER